MSNDISGLNVQDLRGSNTGVYIGPQTTASANYMFWTSKIPYRIS